jgi:hypothetical protein
VLVSLLQDIAENKRIAGKITEIHVKFFMLTRFKVIQKLWGERVIPS